MLEVYRISGRAYAPYFRFQFITGPLEQWGQRGRQPPPSPPLPKVFSQCALFSREPLTCPF